MHSSKQSDFERDFEETISMVRSGFEGKRSMLDSTFERTIIMVESAFEGKQSMLERAFEGNKSMPEQLFRALSGLEARSSNDFERSVVSKEKEACSSTDFERSVAFRRSKKQARAMISSAQQAKSRLEQ